MSVPALYLVRHLVEGCPSNCLVITFSVDASGAVPSVVDLFAASDWASTMSSGTLVYLGAGDDSHPETQKRLF
eukprot:4340932-Amphidinium_carterae.1